MRRPSRCCGLLGTSSSAAEAATVAVLLRGQFVNGCHALGGPLSKALISTDSMVVRDTAPLPNGERRRFQHSYCRPGPKRCWRGRNPPAALHLFGSFFLAGTDSSTDVTHSLTPSPKRHVLPIPWLSETQPPHRTENADDSNIELLQAGTAKRCWRGRNPPAALRHFGSFFLFRTGSSTDVTRSLPPSPKRRVLPIPWL